MPKRKLPILNPNRDMDLSWLHPMHRLDTIERDKILDSAAHQRERTVRMQALDAQPYTYRLNFHVIGLKARHCRAHPDEIRRDMLAPARRSAKDLRMDKRAERMAARMGFKPVPTTEQKISLPDDLFD